jgi:hypothetical protein
MDGWMVEDLITGRDFLVNDKMDNEVYEVYGVVMVL